ncbi:hypothetical protein, variant 2 [Exophiala oligosperma]|uniref:Uncharacterized protein n=1 Tax=Exophiala oligosperma TaxID=215243 RepID=A0A0D2D168_9EURO|nr:hypothetical protein, variant 2 [Exophiala oligosperma]KIW35960.1 hypothetical protein, variant 2 [Exophiala oligosperma]
MWRSSLHDSLGEGRISGATSLHENFSLAQSDDDSLAEGLGDDLDSLFSGVPPDLELSRDFLSDEELDSLTQNDSSQGIQTRGNFIIISPGDGAAPASNPKLLTDIDAIDLTTRSNAPPPRFPGLSSSQRCFSPSSRDNHRVEVVIPSPRPSAAADRNTSCAQLAEVIETADGVGRRKTSPRPDDHIERLSGQKRQNMSEPDLCFPNSRRRRVEAVNNKTPSISHRTLVESSASQTCGTRNQFQPLDFEHGTLPVVGDPDATHGPDSEQVLIGRGANSDREDEVVPDLTLGVPPTTPAALVDIDESMNRDHEHERQQGGWKGLL